MKPSEVIQTYGWTKSALVRSKRGPQCNFPQKILKFVNEHWASQCEFCAIGAIRYSAAKGWISEEQANKILVAVEEMTGTSVAIWNDHQARDKASVVLMLREAERQVLA